MYDYQPYLKWYYWSCSCGTYAHKLLSKGRTRRHREKHAKRFHGGDFSMITINKVTYENREAVITMLKKKRREKLSMKRK